ncbi:glycosyltransferase family 2 protein [Gelidibacter salicanalis]|nr:glycosyltransferase family 2 protein [Gelidibacter salicanalis]
MPALNEAKTIYNVLSSIPKEFFGFDKISLLVVDDGSSDHTEREAMRANATVLSHKHNKGVGSAFVTAVDYALKTKADILVSIDADGQFDVNQIAEMIAPINESKADFCIGNRFLDRRPENMPLIKYWGNKQVNKLVGFISEEKIQDASCGFRAYSREALMNLNLHGSFTYTHEVILDLLNKGYSVSQVPVNVTYFEDRESRVASNLISYAVKTSKISLKCLRDYKPFYFFGIVALGFFLVSFFLGAFVAAHWIFTESITPYKSFGIISLILFLVSILFLVLALLADMLGRIRHNQEKILALIKGQTYEKD